MKILVVTILLFASTYTVYSQDFGIQAGARINTSGIEYPGVEVNRKVGFEGGVFYRHPINTESLSLRVAMLYFMQEFSLESDMGNSTGITYHFREDNLKLPLTVEWYPLAGSVKPFLQAGLYASCSVSGKIKDSDSSSTLKYKKGGNRIDYGALVGLGVYLTPKIALNANYEHGFADRDLTLGDQFVSVKNRGFSVMLQYLF